MTGHPKHQLRTFTVTVDDSQGKPQHVNVTAQSEQDAVLRAGMVLGERHPGGPCTRWIVIGVHDPADAR